MERPNVPVTNFAPELKATSDGMNFRRVSIFLLFAIFSAVQFILIILGWNCLLIYMKDAAKGAWLSLFASNLLPPIGICLALLYTVAPFYIAALFPSFYGDSGLKAHKEIRSRKTKK